MAVAIEHGKEVLLLQSTTMNANEEALLLQSTAKSANVVFLTGGCGNRHAPEQRTSVGAAEHHPEELGSGYKVGDAVQPQAMAPSFGIDGPQWMASSLCYDGKTYFGGARSATAATCDDDDEKDDDAAATGDDDADKPPVTCLIGGAVRDGGMEVLAYGEESDLLRACVDCGQVTGRFCETLSGDGDCMAATWIPSESWAQGQRTPLCSSCDWRLGACHFCRKVCWATLPKWQ